MITEYFGLPGSGKTYLAQKFSQEHRVPLIEVSGRLQKYFWALIFVCARPRTFFFFLKEMIKENGRDAVTAFFLVRLFNHKVHNLYLRAIAKEGKAFFRRNAVVDEGLFQILLYIFERKIEKEDLISFASLLRGRVCYIVMANAETRGKRMRDRGRTPRAFMAEAYKGREKDWSPIYAHMKDAYRDQRWFPMLEHNGAMIAGWIKENFPHKEINNE